MKHADDHAKALDVLLKQVLDLEVPEQPTFDDPVGQLVYAFLLWDASTEKASAAYEALMKTVVDFNDLRVTMSHEVAETIGVRYPRALDRCQRLRACLRDIFNREHDVSLRRLEDEGKREVKKYLESLDGIVPFVSARVMLLEFDAHAIPVDEQLRDAMVDADAAEEDVTVDELATRLTRLIKAAQGRSVHLGLQQWVETQSGGPRQRRKSSSRSRTRRKSSSKTSSRKSGRTSTRKKSSTRKKKTAGT